MPRSFNITVFNQQLYGAEAVFSDPEVAAELGRADQLRIQLIARNAVGDNVKVKVTLQDSNDGENFVDHSGVTLWDPAEVIDSTPVFQMKDTGSAVLGNYIRLKIELSADTGDPTAHIKLIACGRTD